MDTESPANYLELSRMAVTELYVTVSLSGDDGDELFALKRLSA